MVLLQNKPFLWGRTTPPRSPRNIYGFWVGGYEDCTTVRGGQENNICGVLGNERQQTGDRGTGCRVRSRMLFSPHLVQKTKWKIQEKKI